MGRVWLVPAVPRCPLPHPDVVIPHLWVCSLASCGDGPSVAHAGELPWPRLVLELRPSPTDSPLWMYWATLRKSSCRKPREVRAGVPNRSPLGRRALTSPAPQRGTRHQTWHQNHPLWDFRLLERTRSWQRLWDPSPGQVFLLQAMEQSSSTRSARPPSVPLLRRSTRIRWLSEPPANRGLWWACGIGEMLFLQGNFSKGRLEI